MPAYPFSHLPLIPDGRRANAVIFNTLHIRRVGRGSLFALLSRLKRSIWAKNVTMLTRNYTQIGK